VRYLTNVAALLVAMAVGLLVPAAASTLAAPAVKGLQVPDGDGGSPEDRDGDGILEVDGEDRCPDVAGEGSFDGCPTVVPADDFTAEARRVAKRLGKQWDRAGFRRRAWATRQIIVKVHVPASAAPGRGLRCAVKVIPVRQRRDGPLGNLMFGKGVPCQPGRTCRVKVRVRTQYFPPAAHRSVRLQLLASPKDTIGWTGADAPLDLRPRR